MLQENREEAWKKYMAYTVQGGTATFTELLRNADLESPFDPEVLKKVSTAAMTWLDNFPVEKLS